MKRIFKLALLVLAIVLMPFCKTMGQTVTIPQEHYKFYKAAIDRITADPNKKYIINFTIMNPDAGIMAEEISKDSTFSSLDVKFALDNIGAKHYEEGMKFDPTFRKQFLPKQRGTDLIVSFSQVIDDEKDFADHILVADTTTGAERDKHTKFLFLFNADGSLKKVYQVDYTLLF